MCSGCTQDAPVPPRLAGKSGVAIEYSRATGNCLRIVQSLDAGAGCTRENKCGWWELTHASQPSHRTMHRRQSRPDDAELRLDARECSREHRALPPPRSKQRVCGCHRTTKKRVHSRTSQVRERPAPRWIASKLGRREREDRSREVRSGAACATWDLKFPCRRPRPYRSNSIRMAIRAPRKHTNASRAW